MIKDEKLQKTIKWFPHKYQKEIIDCKEREIIVCAGRRFGKALWIETPILTKDGWKTMGELNVGDIVYSQDGKETTIIGTTEIMYGRDCYNVVFSDGSSIIADAQHQWVVEDKNYRKNKSRNPNTENRFDTEGRKKKAFSSLKIKTTEELLKDFKIIRKDGKIESNYSIPTCKEIQFNKKELKLDPYVLGLWLGDGTSLSNGLTFSYEDGQEIKKEIEKRGYILEKKKSKHSWAIKLNEKRGNNYVGISYNLKEIGVFGNKHIPKEYKFGSVEQRLDLLRGLMDTDGTIGKNGSCEYCGVNKKLVEDVNEIVLSLGIKSCLYEYDCFLYGRYIGKKYRITFTTNLPVFCLKRKLKRLKKVNKSDTKRRFIKNIEKINSVPVKCIEVDREDGIYLAGKNLIPTHNSAVCGYIVVRELINAIQAIRNGKRNSCKIWIVAPTYELTNKVFEYVIKFLLAIDKEFGKYISLGTGRPGVFKMSESIWIQCKSTTEPMSLLGEELDLEIIDEAALIPETVYNQYIYPTTIAKSRNTRVIMISTPRGANWFKNKFNILKEKGSAFQFTTLQGVETDEVRLEEIRKVTPELLFRQEYLAEFVSDAGVVFHNFDIVPYEQKEGQRGRFYVMGVDLGTVNDYTVITVIDRESHEVVYWERFRKIDYTQQKDIIREKALRYNNARVVIDATGVGKPIYQDLKNAGVFIEDFTFSGKTKTEMIGKLIIFIEEKYMNIPNIPVLVDEMKAFEYKFINERTGEPLKTTQYGAPKGYHDDAVMSLGLAVWGLNLDRPQVKTQLQTMLKANKIRRVKSYL